MDDVLVGSLFFVIWRSLWERCPLRERMGWPAGVGMEAFGTVQVLRSDNENGSCCGTFELYMIRVLHNIQSIEVFLIQVSRNMKI